MNWTISADTKYNTPEQLHLAEKLFHDSDVRFSVLRRPEDFTRNVLDALPSDLRDLGNHLHIALQTLVEAYWSLEDDIDVNRLRVPGRIYKSFHGALCGIAGRLENTQDIVARHKR